LVELDDLNIHEIGTTRQIIGTIYGGHGEQILCYFPDGDDGSPTVKLEMTVEEWERFIQQTDRVEVEGLEQAPDGKLVKVILRKSARQITQGVNWTRFKADHYRCRYCGKQGGDNGCVLTVDHLVLWENMGPSTFDNLLTACKKCNKVRGNQEYADWLRSRYYKQVSRGLPAAIIEANDLVAHTLKNIPRRKVVGKRR
jgi:hypothetical protein